MSIISCFSSDSLLLPIWFGHSKSIYMFKYQYFMLRFRGLITLFYMRVFPVKTIWFKLFRASIQASLMCLRILRVLAPAPTSGLNP